VSRNRLKNTLARLLVKIPMSNHILTMSTWKFGDKTNGP